VKIHELDAILSRKAFSAVGLIKGEQGRFDLKESRFARFEHEGQYHHAMLTPFSIPQWPWIIGVHLPEDDYLGDLKKSRLFNILLTLVISVVATVIALYFARSIIRPITNLEKEALAVKNDDMQTRFNINSRYKEIQETADSFRLMKEAIRKSREKYSGIFESIEEGYFETDLAGNFTFYNGATSRILGRLKSELPGMNIRNYTSRETAQKLFMTFKEVYRTGKPCRAIEFEIIRKDREKRFIEMSVSLVQDAEGKPQGFRGIGRDATVRRLAENERKRLEDKLQQVQRLEAIGTLAGGIAHDFNNLLMGIQGNVDLLSIALDETDPRYENTRSIERCVRSGANLTRQLLGYARGGKYFVKPINLNDVVQTSSTLFGRTKKETKVICEYQEDIWTVEVDRSQIEQVLVNMYLNAWQAMGHRGTINVKTENVFLDSDFVRPYEAVPGKYVSVSIGDSGRGMDQETQKRVFEPFFTTKSMGKGTGMGLASAFGILKNHNGIIHFTSTLGKGTTFYIYLPSSDLTAENDTTLEENVQPGSETILVVDDEDHILDACKAMLTKLGYNTMLALSGEEAVEIFRRDNGRIDLIILDMVMPGMDGLTAYEHLKEINPDVKFILSSGYSLTGVVKEILDKGCDEYIQKPFSLSQISLITRELLDKNADS
jgi:PAS domain S-box-containing protein